MEQRNLIIAFVLMIAILFGFQMFVDPARPPAPKPATQTSAAGTGSTVPQPQGAIPGATPPTLAMAQTRDEVLARSPRVTIDTPRLKGSIALIGGRVDDITLRGYREQVDPNSPLITLLNPSGRSDAYYAETGWVAAGDAKPALPGADTVWTADRTTLTPAQPVTLSWDNGQGLRFFRQYSIDANYMISVAQRVENYGSAPVTLFPYALVSRTGKPQTMDFFILHEGLVGVLNDTLREHKYTDLLEPPPVSEKSRGGWLGITDKYWLVALIPSAQEEVQATFRGTPPAAPGTTTAGAAIGAPKFQVDYLGQGREIAPGAAGEANHRLFAGAKEVNLLQDYQNTQNIHRFDYAVDWGWFFFLTHPIFWLLDKIHKIVGNFGISILVLTVIVKALFFPLANRSYGTMSKMKKLAPKMQELREKYGDDRVKMNQELMEIYRKEKVNPLSGCLPILVQIPVFFSLYKVLFVTIEMRHAPFYGWIKDLSAPDPTTIANLFGLIPWTPPSFLMLGAWPILMGVTMYVQQKLNPAPTDPIQAKIFGLMPIIFTFMLASFPAGLVGLEQPAVDRPAMGDHEAHGRGVTRPWHSVRANRAQTARTRRAKG